MQYDIQKNSNGGRNHIHERYNHQTGIGMQEWRKHTATDRVTCTVGQDNGLRSRSLRDKR